MLKCSLQNLAFIDKPPKSENEAEETKKQVITENPLEVTNMAQLISFNFKEKQSSDNQNDDKNENESGNSLEERELKLDKHAQNLNEKSEELLVEGEDKEILILI